jgi:hypothetical protein
MSLYTNGEKVNTEAAQARVEWLPSDLHFANTFVFWYFTERSIRTVRRIHNAFIYRRRGGHKGWGCW